VRRAFPFPHPVHRLTYVLRRLVILSPDKDSLRISFYAFFRADPCLQLLEELERDLGQKAQRMTVRRFAPKAKSTSYIPQEVRFVTLHGAHQTRLFRPPMYRVLATEDTTLKHAMLVQPARSLYPRPTTSAVAIAPQSNL
jgi:hypothetical protein